jgi:hypothetical protein
MPEAWEQSHRGKQSKSKQTKRPASPNSNPQKNKPQILN